MVKTFRKKPVIIKALQFNGSNTVEIKEFVGNSCNIDCAVASEIIIHTLEGDMKVSIGDYVIRGVNGEFYPCKPDIFIKTYEEV